MSKVHNLFISFFISGFNCLIKFVEKLNLVIDGFVPHVAGSGSYVNTILVFGWGDRLIDIAQRVWPVQ